MTFRIYLSPPNVGELEKEFIVDALESGWVAPLGPHVEGFEREISDFVGVPHAVALSSGTAGLHLCLVAAGIGDGHEVIVPTMTFAATAFAVKYVGATPIFIDSEAQSWNVDPTLLEAFLNLRANEDNIPAALIAVDVFGQTANYSEINEICKRYGVLLIEDAAESLGATYEDRHAGSFGQAAVFSFNGNKIMTTSGGGMVVSHDGDFIARIRHLATQARQPVPWYEHEDVGYNYRLSNLLAALGRAQLKRLPDFINNRREARQIYSAFFSEESGAHILQDANWGQSNGWLSVAYFDDPNQVEMVRTHLAKHDIESRHVWKPMHLQPVFSSTEFVGTGVAQDLFEHGLCLPSSSGEVASDVVQTLKDLY
jgi:dTDP-4-amino-4,6-dideoxygalactose transaminase